MNSPLSLFRSGYDTLQIAKSLRITEAQALTRMFQERSKELGKPAETREYISPRAQR